tara:strand:+ start:4614 stop:5846 length:1233 start_codon:yes stop_codon:yes gene_type:complete
MSENNRTLKINPDLFKLNGKSKKEKNKSVKIKTKPTLDDEDSSKVSKLKKEMMKKVKDYQKNKEQEVIKEQKLIENPKLSTNNLFETNTYENSDFDREFNKSLNFLHDLAKKNQNKKNNKSNNNKTLKNNTSALEINLELPDNFKNNKSEIKNNYGCLKNGEKPTYRQLNKTQKNDSNFKPKVKIVLENNIYDDNDDNCINNLNSELNDNTIPKLTPGSNKPKLTTESNKPEFIEILDNKIEKLDIDNTCKTKPIDNISKSIEKEKYEENKNKISELSDKRLIDDINTNIESINIKEEKEEKEDISIQNIPKIKKTTKKYTYKLGKSKNKNIVGILIKNRETQKNIKREVSQLKQKSIQDIKNYLRDKNLIKIGSDAPYDVLRKIYEDSILAGEITNINDNNMIYNYLNP